MNATASELMIEERLVHVGDVRLNVATAGPRDGRPVLLLHGFPEFWFSWRYQIPFLAARGFRVIAPDLRGHNLSEKPKGVRAYTMDKLVADLAGLVDAEAGGRADVVGHDWGGACGWVFAERHPARVRKLVLMNTVHPAILLRAFRGNLRQLRRSWYMLYFQLPLLPERTLSRPDFVARALRGSSQNPDAWSDDVVARYRGALGQPGAPTAMINYYRAALHQPLARLGTVQAPTLVVWGDRDPHLGVELVEDFARGIPNLQVTHIPDGAHFVQQDRPEVVNAALASFLG